MPDPENKNLRFNMGCGYGHREGYVNVDLFPECNPDQVADLETLPWPWPDSCASAVLFNHSLEHMGASTSLFLGMIKELYRICQDGAIVDIRAPHPRHDDFINDPSHVRIITPQMFMLFSKAQNDLFKEHNAPSTPYAYLLDIDFEFLNLAVVLSAKYKQLYESGQMPFADIVELANERNNIICEYHITLKAIKAEAP